MVTCKYIKELVEEKTGIEDISVKSRETYLIYARAVTYALCVRYAVYGESNQARIGYVMGRRDHTTVHHGLKVFNNLYSQNVFKKSRELFLYLSKIIINIKSIKTAEEFLQSKDICNHPRINDRNNKDSFDVAELMEEYADLSRAF